MKRFFSVLLVLFLIAGTILYLRWGAWFGNPVEPAYTLPDSICRVIVTPGQNGYSDQTFNWVSGEKEDYIVTLTRQSTDEDSILTFFMIAKRDEVPTDGGVTYHYHTRFEELPAGHYSYMIEGVHQPVYHDSIRITPPLHQETYIYIGDIQEVHESADESIFNRINAKYPDATAWLFGGDAIERGHNIYWDLWYHSVSHIAPEMPIIAVTGNHEYEKGIIKKLDPRWVHTFNYPLNGPDALKGRNYYIDYSNVRIVCLDSDGINFGPSLFQTRKWLKEVLNERPDVFHILMFHHAIYSVRKGRLNPIMRYGFRSIIEDPTYKVDLVLQGHDHAYSRIITKGADRSLHTPVYVITACSPKYYENGFDPIHDKLGSGLRQYQVITTTPDSLIYRSFTDDDALYDQVTIVKTTGERMVTDQGKDIPEVFNYALPDTPKGRKKAAKYQEEVLKRQHDLNRRSQ